MAKLYLFFAKMQVTQLHIFSFAVWLKFKIERVTETFNQLLIFEWQLCQFASMISWSLSFDLMKARTSALVNHFSIYRRLTSTISCDLPSQRYSHTFMHFWTQSLWNKKHDFILENCYPERFKLGLWKTFLTLKGQSSKDSTLIP